jgi:hypothetical protein
MTTACCLTLILAALGQTESESEAELKRDLYPYYSLAAVKYEFHLDEEKKQRLQLEPRPVLTWTNSKNFMGAVFVWTSQGRPELIGCIGSHQLRPGVSNVFHEFHSLSERPLQPIKLAGTLWQPKMAGVEFGDVAGAPRPHESDKMRLLQMRNIAREFSGAMKDGDDVTELRLLTQPIFRYRSEEREVVDGAIFAMVWQGTDPEVLLLLEARGGDADPRWQFALARFNFRELWVKRKDKEVWRVDVARQDDNYVTGVVGERTIEEIREANKASKD